MTTPMPLEDLGWDRRAHTLLHHLAEIGVPFTADDLHEAGHPPHRNAITNLINHAKHTGLIHNVGYRKSTRGPRKGGWTLTWAGTNTQETAA